MLRWLFILMAALFVLVVVVRLLKGRALRMTKALPTTNLQFDDVKLGDGLEAVTGKTVRVHYVGSLALSGKVFDTSRTRGDPFTFTIGQGRVIAGWEKGLVGMRVGGIRKLTVPAHLGYGDRGAGGGAIPPKSTLIFEIELLEVT